MKTENDWSGKYFLMRKGYDELQVSTDIDLPSSVVYFNHWTRRLNPFKSLAEGDTIYLLDNDRRSLAVELRVASLVASPYETRQDGMDRLRAVFGVVEPDEGWPGYDPDPGPGFLLAYGVHVIAPIDVPFEFRWDILGGRHGYISVETFAASEKIDSEARDAVLAQLPTPGRPIRATADSADTRAVINDELLARAPRRPFPSVMKSVVARSGWVCETEDCMRRAAHFDHIVPWSKGGNSDLVNIQHLCQRCNLSKSDRMPDSYLPEQMWITFFACDLDGESITVGDKATAIEVRTQNSVYDAVYDDDKMLVWKRGQRRIWCAADPGDRGLLTLPRVGQVLACGVDHKGRPINDGESLLTSPIEGIRDVCVDETLRRLGKAIGSELQFTE